MRPTLDIEGAERILALVDRGCFDVDGVADGSLRE
jgi:hypothetical protein